MPGKKELPSTVRKSPSRARQTWIKTHDSAVQQYGEGERAHRTAFAALKHSFERIRDRWLPRKSKGPSDPRSAQTSTRAKRQGRGATFGGVDELGHTREELYARAKRLDVPGRSKMSKKQLAREIAKRQ